VSPFACEREREIAEVLRRGHWPQASAPELRAHAAGCRACSDLVLVTQAFQQARREAVAIPRLDSPGAIWWRAQLRRRNAAIERIGRPLFGAQVFALVVSLLVAAGAVAWQVRQGHSLISWVGALPRILRLDVLFPASLADQDAALWVLIPILGTIALLSGVVIFTTSEKQ
jgi:hypothetical protein